MDTFQSIGILVFAYLLGSVPVGLWLVWMTTGKDVRQVGSGRIGGTNVLRAAGSGVALASVIGDILKGLLPVLVARRVVGIPAVEALAGLLAVIGHNYSIFIGFKGGAGTMTTIGSSIALWPWMTLIVALVGLPTLIISRYASLASSTVALLVPTIYVLRALLGNGPWAYLIHGLGTAALTLWSLRPNIQRLRAGNERRVTFRQSPESDSPNTGA